MKVSILDDIIIYLNKEYLKKNEKDIKKLILNIKDIYKFELDGYLNINIYKDKYYGMIIEIKKTDYLDYFKSELEMNINIIEDRFIYEIDDLINIDYNLVTIYLYKDKIYIKPKEDIIIDIIEKAKIIYGKETKKIKKNMEVNL